MPTGQLESAIVVATVLPPALKRVRRRGTDVAAANPHLPFERAVSAITVIAEQSPGRWRVRWRLPLRR